MPACRLHNCVPIKRWFTRKWMCVRCGETFLIDPSPILATQQKIIELQDNMLDLAHALKGSYLISEEP